MARNVARKDKVKCLKFAFLAKRRERWRERSVTSAMIYYLATWQDLRLKLGVNQRITSVDLV